MRTMHGSANRETPESIHRGMVVRKSADEGGCGVVGYASTLPFGGQHILQPCIQMHNRGNGKGGGIAAAGLCADDLSISQQELEEDFLIQIALIDPTCRRDLEARYLLPHFDIHHAGSVSTVPDYRDIDGLESKPPDVWRYFCRVKEEVLARFMKSSGWEDNEAGRAEEEFVFRNSCTINEDFYRASARMRAFVLSHGRDMMILKVVGYAEHVIQYYQLEDVKARVWIGHQRYPTKGKVWHPGGAHPFMGMNEGLVHNGDFANYTSVVDYLAQRGRTPQFSTDTEVAVHVFDLLNRTYRYPLEYIIEALAPTTERDFELLSPEKQYVYRAIQQSHIHGSPDGPWFFIIARTIPARKTWQLIGITDTSMLRPQVFAMHTGDVSVGLIASEKQAIDATLQSLASADDRICPVADHYWNARGGSHTDGGSFIFTVTEENGHSALSCTNKFDEHMTIPAQTGSSSTTTREIRANTSMLYEKIIESPSKEAMFRTLHDTISNGTIDPGHLLAFMTDRGIGGNDAVKRRIIECLMLTHDRRYHPGPFRRRELLHYCQSSLSRLFDNLPPAGDHDSEFVRIDWHHRHEMPVPHHGQHLVIDATDFPVEGGSCLARFVVEAHAAGWLHFVCYHLRGHRFIGSGLGSATDRVTLDVFGSSGDYLGSSMDGAEIHVHGSGQDQIGQILKRGKLVFHGDVGQTLLYGAKGGDVFIMGQVAGRPLINAVGSPKAVINGTCLDYLAESFMAGNPLEGGGFAIVNGLCFDAEGTIQELPTPYPGGNLFSLASGGAIYIRDPHDHVSETQLNGGEFMELSDADWSLIQPYLEENERLFDIRVDRDLLTVDGRICLPRHVYKKIIPIETSILNTHSDFLAEF